MDRNEYKQLGLVTEPPITDELVERLEMMAPDVAVIMEESVRLAEVADSFKRAIYYGKMDETLDAFDELGGEIPFPPMLENMLEDRRRAARTIHAILGLISELGELSEAFLDAWDNGQSIDIPNLVEEIGDQKWYTNLLVDEYGLDEEDICKKNIAKLEKRFGPKFSQFRAVNRNLDAERDILEAEITSIEPALHEAMRRIGVTPIDEDTDDTPEQA